MTHYRRIGEATNMSIEPTLAQRLCQTLEDDIVSGRLLPGQQLEENALVNRFKCSRTPVREALHLLVATELVIRRPQHGVFVATLTPQRMLQLFEAMAEMEALCARLCILRMSNSERRALIDMHELMQDVVKQKNAPLYAKLNSQFHNLIYSGTKNEALVDLSRQARRRVASYRRVQFNDVNRLESSNDEHGAFVRAVELGDAQLGYNILYDHIMAVQDVSLEYLKKLNAKLQD